MRSTVSRELNHPVWMEQLQADEERTQAPGSLQQKYGKKCQLCTELSALFPNRVTNISTALCHYETRSPPVSFPLILTPCPWSMEEGTGEVGSEHH